MATRSTIAMEYLDGTVRQVYCHWDGYLNHNGYILQEHYSNPVNLNKLIELGDLSTLGKDIGVKHKFDEPVLDKCKFYGRDRGETGVEPKLFSSYKDYTENLQYEEYNYILRFVDGETVWFIQHYDSNGTFEPLTLAFDRASVECLK